MHDKFNNIISSISSGNLSADDFNRLCSATHSILKRGDGKIDFRSKTASVFEECYLKSVKNSDNIDCLLKYNSFLLKFNCDVRANIIFLDRHLINISTEQHVLTLLFSAQNNRNEYRFKSIINYVLEAKEELFLKFIEDQKLSNARILNIVSANNYGKIYNIITEKTSLDKFYARLECVCIEDYAQIILDILKKINAESEQKFSNYIKWYNNKSNLNFTLNLVASRCFAIKKLESLENLIDFYLVHFPEHTNAVMQLLARYTIPISDDLNKSIFHLIKKSLVDKRKMFNVYYELNMPQSVLKDYCDVIPETKKYLMLI